MVKRFIRIMVKAKNRLMKIKDLWPKEDENKRRLRIRKEFALSHYLPKLALIDSWLESSNEETNFTYDIGDMNIQYMASMIAVVTKKSHEEVLKYIGELQDNDNLRNRVKAMVQLSEFRHVTDEIMYFGRRLGWYAFARILKPKIIVETGVEKGLGQCCLREALRRNQEEGYPGFCYGTDLNPRAGFILPDELQEFGKMLYGDSILSLQNLDEKIDLFINDSDHSPFYEFQEYQSITDKLTEGSVILGDNSESCDALMRYSWQMGRKFLFFQEYPKDHWYPGGGIGISFK